MGLVGRPRLLDRVHEAVRRRNFSRRTEEACVHWIKRFIYFHGKRHPETLGEPLRSHLERVRLVHTRDLREGHGDVHLPYALARKYPRAEYRV